MKSKIKYLFQQFSIPTAIMALTVGIQFFAGSINEYLDESINTGLKSITSILIIISLTWLSINLIAYGKKILLKKHELHSEDNLKARKVYTQISIIQRILNFIIIIISIALILLNFDSIRKVGISLLASAGIAGLIIGFAAQKLLTTIIAGLQIAFTQPIRIDDVVIVEKEWGWIEEITLTYVVIRIWDKRRLIVPTTYFMETPFQNWTRNTSEILGSVFIYTDYSVPVDEIRKELTRIVENHKDWDGQTNVLQVTHASDKTVELRALVSSKNSPASWDLRVDVREKLIKFLQVNYPECLPKNRISLEKQTD